MTWVRLRGAPEASRTRPSFRQGRGVGSSCATWPTPPQVEHLAERRLDLAGKADLVAARARIEAGADPASQSIEPPKIGRQVERAVHEVLRPLGDQFRPAAAQQAGPRIVAADAGRLGGHGKPGRERKS